MAPSHSPLETFQRFIAQEALTNQKLLLMVSGGVDSMVLLDVAAKCVAPELLAVFHLDHNAREDSSEDLIFVQNFCSNSAIKFYHQTLDPLAKGGTGGSHEANWRKERRRLGQAAADDFGAHRILTAHHATDLVETMIFRLAKGAGPSGLSPFDTDTKPFWKIPKTDLIAYAETNNLAWREDESNLNKKFERNLIRHEVLPALRQITPNVEKVFVQEAKLFDEINHFLEESTPALDQPLPLSNFLTLKPILQRTWLRQVSGSTPSSSEVEDCLKWLHGNPQGNSQKSIGSAMLKIEENKICVL